MLLHFAVSIARARVSKKYFDGTDSMVVSILLYNYSVYAFSKFSAPTISNFLIN